APTSWPRFHRPPTLWHLTGKLTGRFAAWSQSLAPLAPALTPVSHLEHSHRLYLYLSSSDLTLSTALLNRHFSKSTALSYRFYLGFISVFLSIRILPCLPRHLHVAT
ncbi:hypothetical protein B0H14DRAFT_3860922, partial [Mycena olivaceomarginata]